MKMNQFLINLVGAKPFASILKGIPLNDENLAYAKWLVKSFHKGKPVRIRWRGKRTHHRDHTIKSEATHFDIYIRG